MMPGPNPTATASHHGRVFHCAHERCKSGSCVASLSVRTSLEDPPKNKGRSFERF
jgi:hypothetical protein